MNSSNSIKFETLWKSLVESLATFAKKKVLRIYLVVMKERNLSDPFEKWSDRLYHVLYMV